MERKIDRCYKTKQAILDIQCQWRTYKAKQEATKLRRHNAAVYIQKCVRRFLAKLELIRLRRRKAAIFA